MVVQAVVVALAMDHPRLQEDLQHKLLHQERQDTGITVGSVAPDLALYMRVAVAVVLEQLVPPQILFLYLPGTAVRDKYLLLPERHSILVVAVVVVAGMLDRALGTVDLGAAVVVVQITQEPPVRAVGLH
jgi:hypothetical protein